MGITENKRSTAIRPIAMSQVCCWEMVGGGVMSGLWRHVDALRPKTLRSGS